MVCRGPAAGSQMAELAAMVAALGWLAASKPAGGRRVELRSDCQWVVETLTGRCRTGTRRGTLLLLQVAKRLLARLRRSGCQIRLRHVRRELVNEADALCRKAYDAILAQGPPAHSPLKAFLRGHSGVRNVPEPLRMAANDPEWLRMDAEFAPPGCDTIDQFTPARFRA